MGKPLAKTKGVKRPSKHKVEGAKKIPRKKIDDVKTTHASSFHTSDGGLSSEDDVPSELSAFDSLLAQCSSKRSELDNSHRKRTRNQVGKNNFEDDEHGAFKSANNLDEENGVLSSQSRRGNAEEDGHKPSDLTMQSMKDDTEDEDDVSSEEDADGFGGDNQGKDVVETTTTSSFHRHLAHILTNEDADKLVKSKWKYSWKMPAIGTSLSKWAGTGERLTMEVSSELEYGATQKLYKHWLDIHKCSSFANLHSRLRFFFSLCNSYRDIMYCNKKPFYHKGEEDSTTMDAYLMHALNHVYKTRNIVSKNNAKLTREQRESFDGSEFLDHGFTRPKVMFLLPLGSIALCVVKRLIQLIPASNKANMDHLDRFYKEFGTESTDDSEEDDSLKTKKPAKPKDFERLFGGNNNDHFMIGIKLTKKSVKLYNDFYSSDIIVSSPLGLITKLGEAEAEKGKDVDYLSSIEVLIIDHADVIAMQNWSHLNTVVEQLNCRPSKQHGTDVMRIRQWYLDGHARFYRQTILLGSFLNPDMNALFNRRVNYEGKVKMISEFSGVLAKVLLQVKQVYERFDASSIVDIDDARLQYFCEKVFPKIKDAEGGTMIFISSYFEYVRVRNFMTSQNASLCLFGDYAEPSDISRARVWFFEGKRKIMLYTERAHFYHRYKIRGITNLFMYSLPERREFYPELINMIEESNNMTCSVLFSRFDLLRLERIVGTSAAKRMVSSDKKMFVFC